MTINEMYSAYQKFNAASSFIIGFCLNHSVYMVKTNDIPQDILAMDVASTKNGGGRCLKVAFKMATRYAMLDKAVKIGCDADLKQSGYNKGENFERLVARFYGQEWNKDNKPFWVGGDIELNGEQVQIKYEKATVISEALIHKLEAAQ